MNNYVRELIKRADAYYEYETTHPDAANTYEHILCVQYTKGETENWHDTDVETLDSTVEFSFKYYGPELDNDLSILTSIYLGQEEVEYDLSAMGEERNLTPEETLWVNKNTNWTSGNGSALYQMYPINLSVIARRA